MSGARIYCGKLNKLDPDVPTGLILGGMGGPDSPASIRPFLRNLFSDPAIMGLPRLLISPLSALIAAARAPVVKSRYAVIWEGKGTNAERYIQLESTSRQATRLEQLLVKAGLEIFAAPAMRYWFPFAQETVRQLIKRGAEQFILLPAYPQYSRATSGSILKELTSAIAACAPAAPIVSITHWHLLSGYLEALAAEVAPVLSEWANSGSSPTECALLFVAHALPEKFIREGDPYLAQTRKTVEAVSELLTLRLSACTEWWQNLPGGPAPLLAFQSRVGPIRWIGPEITAEVDRLAAAGCRRLLVQPVSFTCEHIETLHELDIELAAHARRAGISELIRGAALNLNEQWLTSMAAGIAADLFNNGRAVAHGG